MVKSNLDDIERLRRIPEKLTTIVALTAYTNEETVKECLDLGIVKVLNKPLKAK